MPTPSKLRFSFKNKQDNKWLRVVNGGVQEVDYPVYFHDDGTTVSPIDWESVRVGYSRNERFYGVFREFSLPLSFTYDASKIIKHYFARDGVSGTVILVIEACRPDSWMYEVIAKGPLDFSTIENMDGEEELYTQVSIAEGGLVQLLKENENIDQTLDLEKDPMAVFVYHDGIELKANYRWRAANMPVVGPYLTQNNGDTYYPPLGFLPDGAANILNGLVMPMSQGAQRRYDNDPPDSAGHLISTNLYLNYDYRFKGEISVFVDGVVVDARLRIRMMRKDEITGTTTEAWRLYNSPPIPPVTSTRLNIDVSGNQVFDNENSLYYLGIQVDLNSVAGFYNVELQIHELDFEIYFEPRMPPSIFKGFRYIEFCDKVFKSALGEEFYVQSSFLANNQSRFLNYDSNPLWTIVTSGTALRGLPEPKIITTISRVYQDLRRWGLGLSIEGNAVRIEKLPYFFQKDRLVADIGEVINFSFYSANEYLGNSILVGYDAKTYEEIDSLKDLFVENTFKFPIDRVANQIDWKSPYHASIWAIEYARSNVFQSTANNDTKYDNDIYLIDTNEDMNTRHNGMQTVYRAADMSKIYGIDLASSTYNWGLSPYRTFMHNKELLLSMGYGEPIRTGRMNFKASTRNALVASQLDSIAIYENGNRQISEFMTAPNGDPVGPLFQPVIFQFEAAIPQSVIDRIDSNFQNRYGVIKFTHPNGNSFECFILDLIRLPATEGLYQIRGLSSPKNDLRKLIDNGWS